MNPSPKRFFDFVFDWKGKELPKRQAHLPSIQAHIQMRPSPEIFRTLCIDPLYPTKQNHHILPQAIISYM